VRSVDLFAGPGGWDLAASTLGVDVTGVELDGAACATRHAAGLKTVQGDVAELAPGAFGPVEMLIASPPCPTFSSAGKGSGRGDMSLILSWVLRVAAGEPLDALRATVDDARSALVLEPVRWAVALEPTYVALEQVPPCIAIWQTIARVLEGLGYRTWTGILEAERYGVPQTRERAILLARRDGRPCHPPAPTHQRYVPGEPRLTAPQLTLDGEVLPWVSMADALGWGMTARPSVSVVGRDDRGGPRSLDGGSGARETLRRAHDDGEFIASPRPPGKTWGAARLRANAQPNAAERAVDELAPTITGGHSTANRVWLDRRQGGAPPRSEDEPAHTMSSSGIAKGRDVWTPERPATADAQAPCGCPWEPGGRNYGSPNAKPQFGAAAVRVTVEEAAALQSFPPDYPWQGSKSKRFQQIGNAVPPLLALHVLAALLDRDPVAVLASQAAA
jgi:DNA (cytosine-5)-methyltransferase 1